MGDYNRPLSLNRWNYVGGNPVNTVDPSGHCYGGSFWDLFKPPFFKPCPSRVSPSAPVTSTPLPLPTSKPLPTQVSTPALAAFILATATSCATPSPISTSTSTPTPTTYNGQVIFGWGCAATDEFCRQSRAEQVRQWIENSNTWWGDHEDIDSKDLARWLLEHEGGSLRNDQTKTYEPNGDKWLRGVHVMVGLFSHLFGDGDISSQDLSTFTAFFNPNRGDTFDANDWYQLTKEPPSYWRDDVERYWAGGLVYDSNGRAIDRWWDNTADAPSGYCSTGCPIAFAVYIPIESKTLYFGYRE